MSCSQRELELTDPFANCSVVSASGLPISPQAAIAAVEVAVCYRGGLSRGNTTAGKPLSSRLILAGRLDSPSQGLRFGVAAASVV
jgi:hypothetical protein